MSETIETIFFSLAVIFIIYTLVALPEVISGSSMEPGFFSDERILVERITKNFKKIERGEVVVFKDNASGKNLIKRVVGMPGDVFKIYNCEVYVYRDGKKFKLFEPYLRENTCTIGGIAVKEGRSFKIPENKYVLLGDNREVSMDSRTIGLVDGGNIVGRVIFRFWPIARISFVT